MDADSRAATQDWMGLQRSLIELRMQIADASDPDERSALVAQLREIRANIARIESGDSESKIEPEAHPAEREAFPVEPEAHQVEPEAIIEPDAVPVGEQPAPAAPVPAAPEPAPAVTETIDGEDDGPAAAGRRWPLIMAAALVAVVGAGAMARSQLFGTGTDSTTTDVADVAGEAPAGPGTGDDLAVEETTTGDSTGEAGTVGAGDPSDAEAGASADLQSPELRISLYDYRFVVQGGVPDEQTMTAIESAIDTTFGDRGAVDVQIDDQLGSPPWLTATPDLTEQLRMLVEGEIIITADQTVLSGVATEQDLDQLTDFLETSGFPPVNSYVDVVDDNPAALAADLNAGTVTLNGVLPNETMRDVVVADLVAAFGQENVIVGVDVDDTISANASVAGFGADVAALRVFDNVDVEWADGSFSAVLDQGLEFEPGESTLDAVAAGNLEALIPFALRTTAPISIDGYTDNSGDHDRNHVLSLERADAVAGVLVDAGVDAGRIATAGLADGNPIASNATAEGRARNRRIVVTIG